MAHSPAKKQTVIRPISTEDLTSWTTNTCGAWKLERMPWPATTQNLLFERDCPRSGATHYRQLWMPALSKLLLPTDENHDEIIDSALELSNAVVEAYQKLRDQVCCNVETIVQIWQEMTHSERRELLLGIWPDLPIHRRPDFTAAWSRGTSESKRAFLCPYINLEDLIKGTTLTDFMRSRAFNAPWKFAKQDYEAAKLGITTQQITHFGLVGHPGLLMFMEVECFEILGDSELKRELGDAACPSAVYGKVIPRHQLRQCLMEAIEDEEERCSIENSYWTTQPGLICLRSQKEAYGFLCGCCELMLKPRDGTLFPESPRSITSSSQGLSSAHGKQDGKQDEDLWSSLLAEAPYQAPCRPQFEMLIDFVDSKRAYTEDHILELRRSPLYFAETLTLYMSNDSRASIQRQKSNQLPTPRSKGQPRGKIKARTHTRSKSTQNVSDDWNKLIQDVQYDAYYDYVLWKSLQELLIKVRKHFDDIQHCIDKDVPIRSKQSLVTDHYRVACALKAAWSECVRKIKPARQHDFDDFHLFHYINASNNKAQLSAKQKVDYLLYQLCPDEVDDDKGGKTKDWHEALDTCLGLHTVADFLDTELRRLADTDSTSRFGPYHAKILSNLVMVAEIDRQLRSYDQNFLGGVINDFFMEVKSLTTDNEEEKQRKTDMRDELVKKPGVLDIVQCGILKAQASKFLHDQDATKYFRTFSRSKYPEGFNASADNINMMVAGERQLDQIWKTFTTHVEEHIATRKSMRDRLHKCLDLDLGLISRTTAVLQIAPVLKDVSANVPKNVIPVGSMSYQPWDFKEMRDNVSKKVLREQHTMKPKLKTRGPTKELDSPGFSGLVGQAKAEQPLERLIMLKNPHYTTIRALWTNEQLKDVPWKDFLRAMAIMGFGLQKLGGSAWLFTPPTEFGFKHSIYMHEPHPNKSMYPEQASWRGRVLTRRYGWTKNTFVLAS